LISKGENYSALWNSAYESHDQVNQRTKAGELGRVTRVYCIQLYPVYTFRFT